MRKRNEKLLARRKACGLTQMEVSIAAGLGVRHYQFLESGTYKPRFDTAVKVAKALSCTTEDIFGE